MCLNFISLRELSICQYVLFFGQCQYVLFFGQLCFASYAKLLKTLISRLDSRTLYNDLKRPQTQISKSGHFLTLNISEMAKDTAKVSMEGE